MAPLQALAKEDAFEVFDPRVAESLGVEATRRLVIRL